MTVLLVVAGAEFLVMLALTFFPKMGILEEAVCDALLLSLLVSPAIFFFARRIARQLESAELAATREQLRDIFDHTTDLIQVTTMDGKILFVNHAWKETTGFSEEEVKTMNIQQLLSPERLEPYETNMQRLATGKNIAFMQSEVRAKDGRIIELEGNLSARSIRGQPREVRAIFRDVTERNRADEAMRRSEEDLAVTLESIGDAVAATDMEGRITRMNVVAEKLTGWKRTEAMGHPIEEVLHIVHEVTRQPAVIPVANVLATGVGQGLAHNTIIISRDGTERPIADSAAPIRNRTGEIIGVVLVFRDVTEERRVEHAAHEMNDRLEERVAERTSELVHSAAVLRESEERFRMMVEGVQDYAILTLDTAGNVASWNAGARRMQGYEADEIIGRHFSIFFPPEAMRTQFPKKELEEALKNGHCENEGWRVRKDGSTFFANVIITPLRDKDDVLHGFSKITRDITERRENEKMALRSQRLESIGTLAGGVAHDLNNALTPILMGIELLHSLYPAESRIIERIEISAKHGADMVRQLLTFAKGARGDGARAPVNARRLLRETEKMIQGSFPKNIKVVIQCDPDLPVVIGDATQLHQVLLNLCLNARDAMPEGGSLTLEVLREEISGAAAQKMLGGHAGLHLTIKVRDTGVGMDAEVRERIFDPFFTTKGPDKGTGLGLSTVMGIVKAHGGFLLVDSEAGRGTTFTASLPGQDGLEDPADPETAGESFRGKGEVILYVDDEIAVRELAGATLERLNFKAILACDGVDGLIQASNYRGELRAVITDMQMPHLDGLSFARAFRRMLPEVPVIVASGRIEEATLRELHAMNVLQRLDKPFTEGMLAEALHNVLST